jgi:phosphate:Na+ symporter
MQTSLDIWKMLAGIAIFMLGMNFLEEGLHNLAGRPFKLFLKKQTSNKLKAVIGGAVVTGLLQSSSIVNLMVLAFVGAGVIQMRSALALILGANLGSTFCNWIVATIGFEFNIESFALPITGIAGILMILTSKESRWNHWFRLLFGFSFLFVGLNYIKTGIENSVQHFDLHSLEHQPAIIFLLAGFIVTSLIQSSSATMAIVLSALHANAIGLFAATAIVLGSEIGTTIKLVIASVKGIAAKKRVALGNLLFNIINTLIIFIFLLPVNRLITDVLGIKDNLIALVFFQSFVNLVGIILFFPFLDQLGKFLEKRFIKTDRETLYIHADATDMEIAIAALEKETRHFIYHVVFFVLNAFDRSTKMLKGHLLHKDFGFKKTMEQYEYIKYLHGELNKYSIQLQSLKDENIPSVRLQQLISSARNTMYAAKNLKDALPDIIQLKRSSNDEKYNFYLLTSDKTEIFFERIIKLLTSDHQEYSDQLNLIYRTAQEEYAGTLKELYKEGSTRKLSEVEFSTLLNFNREMYTLEKSILFAMKDLLLNEKEAAHFDELPGFIR